MTSSDLKRALDVWYTFFADEDANVVLLAVKNVIQSQEFPPTIADIKNEIKKMKSAVDNDNMAVDEWNAIRRAISNSAYHAKEMFITLPENAQRFVGSPEQLRSWATSTDFNAEVVRGQFLKQYDSLNERKVYSNMLNSNPQLKALLHGEEQKLLNAEEENG